MVHQTQRSGHEPTNPVQSGAVRQQFAHRDLVLALGGELGPVLRHRRVVVDDPASREPVQHRGRDALARGEREGDGVVLPERIAAGHPAHTSTTGSPWR